LAVEAVPSSAVAALLSLLNYSFPSFRRLHFGCSGETTTVMSWSWWRKLVGGVCGGVEASSSRGSYAADRPGVVDWVFSGEILVGLLDTDVVPPAGGSFPC
jgi:hypothetical protein